MRPETGGKAAAIIVAGGRGTRLGAADKVLVPLGGRPLLSYAIETAESASSIAEIIVVAGAHTIAPIELLVEDSDWAKVRHIALGGDRRQDSVEAGLQLVRSDLDIVAVHDAARPFATAALFNDCVEAALRVGAAIAAVPVSDTLKREVHGTVSETIPRDGIWSAQTPQAFRTELLRRSFAYARSEAIEVTDESRLVELQGLHVAIVPGSSRNFKITRPEDIEIAEAMLQAARAGAAM
jgi:2-C-methyl-D-erythritol 4-phosphate cytidylyltransferase